MDSHCFRNSINVFNGRLFNGILCWPVECVVYSMFSIKIDYFVCKERSETKKLNEKAQVEIILIDFFSFFCFKKITKVSRT